MIGKLLRLSVVTGLVLGLAVFAWTRIPITAWYRDRRPTRFGKVTNRAMGKFAAIGVPSFSMVALEVPGRVSGRPTSTVLVLVHHEGAEYLVSMLGERVDWVKNVHATSGHAAIRHGGTRQVVLHDVPAEERAPILQTYLRKAPGARPHIPVSPDAPIEAFREVASDYPVFRVIEAALVE